MFNSFPGGVEKFFRGVFVSHGYGPGTIVPYLPVQFQLAPNNGVAPELKQN